MGSNPVTVREAESAISSVPEKVDKAIKKAMLARAQAAIGAGNWYVRSAKFRRARKTRKELYTAICEALGEARRGK